MVSVKFLKSHSFFGGVQEKDVTHIRAMLRRECFSVGEDIIRQGETGNAVYFLYSGAVDVIKSIRLPGGLIMEKKIVRLKRGSTFGEMELIDIEPRTATVRAATDVKTYSLSGMDFYKIRNWNEEVFTIIIMNLAREISRRLRMMDEQAVETMLEIKELKEAGIYLAKENRKVAAKTESIERRIRRGSKTAGSVAGKKKKTLAVKKKTGAGKKKK